MRKLDGLLIKLMTRRVSGSAEMIAVVALLLVSIPVAVAFANGVNTTLKGGLPSLFNDMVKSSFVSVTPAS